MPKLRAIAAPDPVDGDELSSEVPLLMIGTLVAGTLVVLFVVLLDHGATDGEGSMLVALCLARQCRSLARHECLRGRRQIERLTRQQQRWQRKEE